MTGRAISREVLAQLAEDLTPEDVAEMARYFAIDTAAMLLAMRAATAAQDEAAWRRAAHRLAGGAGGGGATVVEATARALMDAPLPADAEAILRLLDAEIDAACAELRALLDGGR